MKGGHALGEAAPWRCGGHEAALEKGERNESGFGGLRPRREKAVG